ncbi:MAG: UDP-N-acetylmuramate dehydrogenase [Petrotogaceae bacterium]|jgi:UDP-N-acetylmuramate dehydrogenase|nr:UDP-N-acetylmuramate dehydrogenase [Petrotogaceae bacterium]
MENFFEDLYLNGCEIKKNEPMKNHTYFRIGGITQAMLLPKTTEAMVYTCKKLLLEGKSFRIMGYGANLIVSDRELDFFVICTKYLSDITFCGTAVTVQCGAPTARLSYMAAQNGLSGLEFASGIPGSVGGAVFMNAGAYEGEFKNIVRSSSVFDKKNMEVLSLSTDQMEFGYRKSIFQQGRYICLETNLELSQAPREEVIEKTRLLLEKRWKKQPLDLPSAGSFFKRPRNDFFVGTAIENLGMKGLRIGGAEISKKHAGFIVNTDNATFDDVMKLSEIVKTKIKDSYNVDLETEPEIWK